MKKLVFIIFFVFQSLFVWSQGIEGRVVDSKSEKPITAVIVTVQNSNLTVLTDDYGNFSLKDIPVGKQYLIITFSGYVSKRFPIEMIPNQTINLGTIFLDEDPAFEMNYYLITLTENDLAEDNSGSETTSGLLQASRDAFQQTAAFNWGQARFKIRGLDNEYGKTIINGVVMNKIYDGRPQWSNWGGLNDVTRNQEYSMGSSPSDYSFGGILGVQSINTRASFIRKGIRATVSGANTNYSNREMITFSSGLNKNGWAYAFSISNRTAVEGYFEGTNYNAQSIFVALEKKFNDFHSLNFTGIYAQNKRGKNAPLTDEVKDIKGKKYNSYWGWQEGRRRNSRYKNILEPILMLSHYWEFDKNSSLTSTVAYQFGKIGNSRLSYKNIKNPDPTYFRNLPSYALNYFDANEKYEIADLKREELIKDGQINWVDLYRANLNNKSKDTKTYLYEDRMDDKTLSFNTNFKSRFSDILVFDAGINYRRSKSSNFKYTLDLLGGVGFEDIDHYQSGDAQQSNLDNKNRIIRKNEKFGYNYNIFSNLLDVFTQFSLKYNRIDLYVAQNISYTSYQREGLYKSGTYPENSKGKSDLQEFNNFGFKAGITYHLSGRHALNMNLAYMNQAPTIKTVFFNARLNNAVIPDIKSENIFSIDGSYIIKSPKLKTRISGYMSEIKNTSNITFYFADGIFFSDREGNLIGSSGNSFVAEIVSGANKKNIGTELGAEYQLTQTIKINAAIALGQSFYTNNPNLKLSSDKAALVKDYGTTYLKNYRIASGPQTALSLGTEYRDPKFWWISANVNYLSDNYISPSPLLRTENFIRDPQNNGIPFEGLTEKVLRATLKQEKLDAFVSVNISGGKSWRFPNRSIIGLSASINNLFNTTYKTGGFEQARIANYPNFIQDKQSGTRTFGNKYFYGFGRNFFVNLYYNF